MDSPFMNVIAAGIGASGIRVARFEFPYMSARRRTAKTAAPDREPSLRAGWQEVIEESGGARRLVIGGKSMGGRIASMVADEAGVLVLARWDIRSILPDNCSACASSICATCALPLSSCKGPAIRWAAARTLTHELSRRAQIAWIEAGDDSFKPPKRSGRTLEQNLAEAVARVSSSVLQRKKFHLPLPACACGVQVRSREPVGSREPSVFCTLRLEFAGAIAVGEWHDVIQMRE